MACIKDFYIFTAALLILIQSTLGESLNVSSSPAEKTKKYLSVEKELLEFTFKNLNDIYLNYGKKVKNISENILKDFPLKKNVTDKDTLLEDYIIHNNSSFEDFEEIFFVLETIINNDHYLQGFNETSKSKNETEVITHDFNKKVLMKIRSEHLDSQCKKVFNDFVAKLKQKLEDTKTYWKNDETLLEWFKEFKTMSKFDDEIDALYEFVHELCGNLNIMCEHD